MPDGTATTPLDFSNLLAPQQPQQPANPGQVGLAPNLTVFGNAPMQPVPGTEEQQQTAPQPLDFSSLLAPPTPSLMERANEATKEATYRAAQTASAGVGSFIQSIAEIATKRPDFQPHYDAYYNFPNLTPDQQQAAIQSVRKDINLAPDDMKLITARMKERASGAPPMTFDEFAGAPVEQTGIYKAGQAVQKFGEEQFPLTPEEQKSIPAQIGGVVGGFLPVGLAATVGLVAPPLALPAMVAVAGGQGAEEGAAAARAKNATEAQVAKSAAEEGGMSAAGMAVFNEALGPIARDAPGLLNWAKAKLIQAGVGSVVNPTLEETQKWLSAQFQKEYDQKAQYQFDPKGVLSEGLTGALMGAVIPTEKGYAEAPETIEGLMGGRPPEQPPTEPAPPGTSGLPGPGTPAPSAETPPVRPPVRPTGAPPPPASTGAPGVSPTTREPVADLEAQVKALADPQNPKNALFVPRPQARDLAAFQPLLPADATTVRTPAGVLVTTDPQKAATFKKLGAKITDDDLAGILGYPETKADALASGQPQVVQGTDAQGHVVDEALASPKALPETVKAVQDQTPEGGHVAVVTPVDAQIRRAEENAKANVGASVPSPVPALPAGGLPLADFFAGEEAGGGEHRPVEAVTPAAPEQVAPKPLSFEGLLAPTGEAVAPSQAPEAAAAPSAPGAAGAGEPVGVAAPPSAGPVAEANAAAGAAAGVKALQDTGATPAWTKGERVEIGGTGDYAGRHGVVSDVHSYTMAPIVGGGGGMYTTHVYTVKTDSGHEMVASPSEIMREQGAPPAFVPDPMVGNRAVPPRVLASDIAGHRAAAKSAWEHKERARTQKAKDQWATQVREQKSAADEKQRILDAWKAKNPEEHVRIFGAAPATAAGAPVPAPGGVTTAPGSNPLFTYHETKHTKQGHNLYVAKPINKVDYDTYKTWLAAAKKLGGSYSAYEKDGAIKGFQFRTPEAASEFMRQFGGQAEAANKPPTAKPPSSTGHTEIGKNPDGIELQQDANGVRSYVTPQGIRVTEPMQMVPTRHGTEWHPRSPRDEEFRTEGERAETAQKPGAEKPESTGTAPEGTLVGAHQDRAVADQVVAALEKGEPIKNTTLQHMGDEAYGGSLASGAYSRDRLYDAGELGVNLFIRAHPEVFNPTLDLPSAREAVAGLEKIKGLMPTQTVRAGEKDALQQFSTPPDYAFAVTWAARLGPRDRILEPSAGTGGLAVHALNAGTSRVWVNELSAKRNRMLEAIGAHFITHENAENIASLFPAEGDPSAIVMNPPFSVAATRMGNKRVLEAGAQHVSEALARLAPGGRLVAIVGRGMEMDAAAFKDWWARTAALYDVRANVGMDGSIYRKYGTDFATRVLVIDKVLPSGRPVVGGNVENASGLLDALKDVRDERPAIAGAAGQQAPGQPTGAPLAPGSQGASGPPNPVSNPARPMGVRPGGAGVRATPAGQQPTGTATGNAPAPLPAPEALPAAGIPVAHQQPVGAVQPGAGGDHGGGAAAGAEPVGGGTIGAGDGVRSDGSGERDDPGVTPAPATVVATENAVTEPGNRELTEAVYEPYQPQRVAVKGAKPHPGPLVQSAAMASVLPPPTAYRPSLPKGVVEKGMLSDAQLEAVIYAGAAHAKILPESGDVLARRRGFFIGDGTGVGKGREVAGIILDNWTRGGVKKALWISEKDTLQEDAKRDWSGLGQPATDVTFHGKFKAGDAITLKKGILFSTYDTMKSEERKTVEGTKVKGKTRLQQVVDWLGPEFDGVIAFDEAHNLGNAVATRGALGTKAAAAKAIAGIELQKALPMARIVYVSATGATEVSNLSYADRLGLWGRGTAFADREDFMAKISSGGVAAMELVARDMKALGHYVSRNLSYDGVEYDRVEHILTPQQRRIYDELASAWQIVLQNFNAALAHTGAARNPRAKSAMLSAFWGGHQRFFNQVITSMQMPSVLTAVEKDIAEGRQAVLQLVNTNEAAQERAVEKAKQTESDLEDLDMTPRDQLMQLIEKSFPVVQHEDYIDDNGNIRSRPVVDSNGQPVINRDAVRAREALLDRLGSIRVPEGPLEMLMNHFGTEKVAEVTGRGQRVVRKSDDNGQTRTVVEKRPGNANVAEANMFQQGKKPILVFSQAGGTGRSYHADVNSESASKRRSHYLVQAGWRADAAVQGFGRTHRTNQASAPIFHLVTTDLQGQKRFISSIARRLAQLGALTKGERRTGDQGMFGLRDNLESSEARTALNQFYVSMMTPEGQADAGISITGLENAMGLKLVDPATGQLVRELPPMTQFLNRLLSLTVDQQNGVFNAFSNQLDTVIDRAAAAGTLDAGVETYRADRIAKKGEQVVFSDPESGAETRHVHLEVGHRNHPLPFDAVNSGRGVPGRIKPKSYVRSVRSGKVFAVSDAKAHTDKDGNIIDQYRLTGPLDFQYIERWKIDEDQGNRNWNPLPTQAEAKAAWDNQVRETPEFHNSDLHIISGAILPIWNRLGGSPHIYRLQTDDGERFLGRVVPNSSIDATLNALGAEKLKVTATPAEVASRVLAGATARMANGWTIKRSLVAGEPRLEMKGPIWEYLPQLTQDGVFTERINYETRAFIPTGDRAAEVIEKISRGNPITQLGEEREALPSRMGFIPPEDAQVSGEYVPITRGVEARLLSPAEEKDFAGLIGEVRGVLARIAPEAPVGAVKGIRTGEGYEGLPGHFQGVMLRDVEGLRPVILWATEGSTAAAGTARHEAIHWLKDQGCITPREWATLEAAARAGNWVATHRIMERYGANTTPEAAIEEAIADEYPRWEASRKRGDWPQAVRAIFNRLLWLKNKIAAAWRRFFPKEDTAEDIFRRVESGEVGAAVGTTRLSPETAPDYETAEEVPDGPAAHILPITPEMRASVMRGQPLFQRERPAFLAQRMPNPKAEPPQPEKRPVAPEGVPVIADKVPTREQIAGMGKAVIDSVNDSVVGRMTRRLISPGSFDETAKLAAMNIRKVLGQAALQNERSRAALQHVRDAMEDASPEERERFAEAVDTGDYTDLSPEMRTFARNLKAETQRATARLQKLGVLENAKEDYLGRIWKPRGEQVGPDTANRVLARLLSKRPLTGSKSFLKERYYDTWREAREAGLEPVYENPVDAQLHKLAEMNRFAAGTILGNYAKKSGYAKFFKAVGEKPEGWMELEGREFHRPTRTIQQEDGTTMHVPEGAWYAPEGFARVFNNFQSRGLEGTLFREPVRILRAASNSANMMQLGFSAYHVAFTTLDAQASRIGAALDQMVAGKFVEGGKQLGAAVSPYTWYANLRDGDWTLRGILGMDTGVENMTPEMKELANDFAASGGRIWMDMILRPTGSGPIKFRRQANLGATILGGFGTAIRQAAYQHPGHSVSATAKQVLNLVGRVVETTAAPTFDYIVPRQKLGVFLRLRDNWLSRNPDADPGSPERVAAMQDIWEMVDNRLGQMVYDNLFWHKYLKDVAFFSTRSVGWNMGFLREFPGAAYQGSEFAAKKAVGHKAEWPSRVSYVIAMVALNALYGTIYNYLATGEPSKKQKDYFFPRTGGTRPDGTPERGSLPTYFKDIYAWSTHPGQTAQNKSSPLISFIAEMLQNRDFYGDIIVNPADPLAKEIGDGLLWASTFFRPFTIEAVQRMMKESGRPTWQSVLGILGVQPAPGYIANPAAEQKYEARQLKSAIRKKARDQAKQDRPAATFATPP